MTVLRLYVTIINRSHELSEMPQKNEENAKDIFQLLLQSSRKKEKEKRTQLLGSLGVKEFFEEGNITINMKTCRGIECNLCVKACPTKALFWRNGEIGITKELCVYCGACVLNCIVDECIQVRRKRQNATIEKYSKPREVVILFNSINGRKRMERVESIFPTAESYLKRYGKQT
jgi:Fe-S-cluster-containing hydrogenase component 2